MPLNHSSLDEACLTGHPGRLHETRQRATERRVKQCLNCMLPGAQEEWSAGVNGQDGAGYGAGSGQPPLMDPVADLKLNQLDIVDAVRERQALLQVWGRGAT